MDQPENEGAPKFSCIAETNVVPEYWDDDERMNVLFSPFRSRDLNPHGYDKKLQYWKNNIDIFCETNRRCSFTLGQVKKFFIRNGKLPLCLNEVLGHMVRDKEVEELTDFMRPISQSYWFLRPSAIVNSASWLKQYAFQTNKQEEVITEDKEFIYNKTLERCGNTLQQLIVSDCGYNKLYSYRELSNLSGMDVATMKIIVHWLLRRKKACVMHPCDDVPALTDTLVRISPGTTNSDVSPITIEMANVHVLHDKEKLFVRHIEELEKEEDRITDEIKSYLKQGMRQLAKSSLKKRKEIEKRIQKKIAVLDNIRSLMSSIEEAKSSGEVLSAHESFLRLFKKYNENVTIDHAENVMDKVVEAIDTYDDIQTTISKPVDVKTADEGDLECELADLLLEDTPNIPPSPPSGTVKRKIGVDDLPDVPFHFPVADSQSKLTKIK